MDDIMKNVEGWRREYDKVTPHSSSDQPRQTAGLEILIWSGLKFGIGLRALPVLIMA
jgi:hypothetical protein